SKAGDVRADPITWSSSSPTTARVGSDGPITALNAGTATITATSGGGHSSLAAQALPADISSISITPSAPRARTAHAMRFKRSGKTAAAKEITGLSPPWQFGPGQGALGSDGAFVGYDAGVYTVSAIVGPRAAQTTVTLATRDVRRPATVVSS